MYFIEIFRILEVLLALTGLIFVHELGHFMAARWCGVYVERFSIFIGPVLFRFKPKETEYAISAIPLGGYVKMRGQTDSVSYDASDDDPKSYQSKSIPQRMLIISAGVIMNIIFAFICFAGAYTIGVPDPPAIIGTAMPGEPAWIAGVRPGDVTLEVDGYKNANMETLGTVAALSTPDHDTMQFVFDRDGETLNVEMKSKQKKDKPMIGISYAPGLEVANLFQTIPGSPASDPIDGSLEPEDLVTHVQGQEVHSHIEFQSLMSKYRDQEVTIRVIRKLEGDREYENSGDEVDVKLAPNYFKEFGLGMQIAPIAAIQHSTSLLECPALKATDADGNTNPLQIGDTIVSVNDVPVDQIDPMRLPELFNQNAGKKVKISIIRNEQSPKNLDLFVVPNDSEVWLDYFSLESLSPYAGDELLTIPGLGIAFPVLPSVRTVKADSPAATVENPIQVGDTILSASIKASSAYDQNGESQELTFHFDAQKEKQSWVSFYLSMQSPLVQSCTLKVKRGDNIFETQIMPQTDRSLPLMHRGIVFQNIQNIRKSMSFGDSIWRGVRRTQLSTFRMYLFLRSIIMGRVSTDNLGGPLTLANIAYVVSVDFALLLEFLGLIGVNLAVMNFLPIPMLDGGHMMFLIYEAIFRKRPGERIETIFTLIGICMILSLMIFVIYLDINRFVF